MLGGTVTRRTDLLITAPICVCERYLCTRPFWEDDSLPVVFFVVVCLSTRTNFKTPKLVQGHRRQTMHATPNSRRSTIGIGLRLGIED